MNLESRRCLSCWLHDFDFVSYKSRASLVAQTEKNMLVIRETWAWSLGWEDPLEKGMVTHFSVLAWRISWMEELGGLQSRGLQRVQHWVAVIFTFFFFTAEPSGKPNMPLGGDLVIKLCPTPVTPWTVACQVPLSMGFSRQEYWSGSICFSRGSAQPRNWTQVSFIAGRFFTKLWRNY